MTLSLFYIAAGILLLYKGAEWLVGSSARIAQHLRVSRVLIGLTIIAIGTSLPELVASIIAATQGAPDVALGNVVGSNMANLGLVLALAVIIKPVRTHIEDLYRDAPWLIFGSVLLLIMAIDGVISRLDGGILVGFAILFYWSTIQHVRREKISEEELPFHEFEIKAREHFRNYALIIVGIGSLILGAQWLITGAVDVAAQFNISELVIGITIVAIGTSLPELAASAWSSVHGSADVTFGNVVGSNIANIFMILGIVSLVAPVGVSEGAFKYDIPILILFTFFALLLVRTKERLTRVEGILLLAIYAGYIVWSFL